MGKPSKADTVIALSEVGKSYVLRHTKPFLLRNLAWRLAGRRMTHEVFWAVRNVSFRVRRGESVGIIGHNGAGKSTLLSMIAGTVYPTRGNVFTAGRVCALLELGAGFHPDLTGRENVFLNASLLGLSRDEAESRFDWIVAFSELGAFIDMPLRTYSSGMYMRLGFSVAIFAEPEILIVDEIFAVGDVDFQKKCLERVLELKSGGTTLLMVTHNLPGVLDLCERAIWVERGLVNRDGPAAEVVGAYSGGPPA